MDINNQNNKIKDWCLKTKIPITINKLGGNK